MNRTIERRAIRLMACAALMAVFLCLAPSQGFADEIADEAISQPVVAQATDAVSVEAADGASAFSLESNNAVEQPDELSGQADSSDELAVASDPESVSDEEPASPLVGVQDISTQASVSIVDGVYAIVSAVSDSKCLDVPWGSADNGEHMQIYNRKDTPAQHWTVRGLGDGTYEIVNVGSGKALDVAGANTFDGATVQQYERNSTAAQKWKLVSTGSGQFKIASALSNTYVLDVAGGSSANGTAVQLWSDNGTKAQRWNLVSAEAIESGFYVVKNVKSDKMLDVSGASLNNGGNMQQYAANGTPGQTFQFAYDSANGYYTITNLGSGKVLDVEGGSTHAGANVQQYVPNGTCAQQWAVAKNADGSFTFRSAASGLALDVTGASSSNAANVQVWASNDTKAQKWSLSSVSSWLPEGSYAIIATINPGNVLDIAGGSAADGANVQMYASNRSNAQKFYFRPVGGGCYTIQNPFSGKYLNVTKKASGGNVVLGSEQQQFKPVFKAGGITIKLKEDASIVLDIAGGSTRSGANLQVYKWNGTDAQRFVVKPMDMFADGSYAIRYASDTNYTIDVPGASSTEGIQLQLYESNGAAAQRFNFKRVAYNTYRITTSCGGNALAAVKAVGGSYLLQQRAVTSAADQQWVVSLDADGAMQLAPKSNGDLRIDISGGTVANGTPLVVFQSNGTAAQKWRIAPASDSATYDVMNMTLRRMAELQKESEYNTMTVAELMDLLDPDKLNRTQFLDLRETTSLTAEQLNAFIVSTDSGWSGMLKGLGSAFVTAAQQQGLNEAYLLAHAILESGWGTSTLAKGYVYEGGEIDGKHYDAGTYYNFYGIGAYDSSPLSGGRKAAIVNGWNTPEKAVTGAAQWIAKNYVYAQSYAQPTLYAMKWDYARTNATGERGWHQYATSTSWPDSIATLINQCYAKSGVSAPQTYIIPKYK